MAEFPPKTTHIWAQIQRLGLTENVFSYDEYERICFIAAHEAKAYLLDDQPDVFSPVTAKIAHRIMFQSVHPWAGAFRTGGESVIISGYPAADAWRISSELQLLEQQSNRWLEFERGDGLSYEQIRACSAAFHHIRFERIHPFRDGNGRVGRLLLGAIVKQLLGAWPVVDWDAKKGHYFDALRAGNSNDLRPLANLVLEVLGLDRIEREIPSPFRVAPRMFEEMVLTSIDDDFQWSLRR